MVADRGGASWVQGQFWLQSLRDPASNVHTQTSTFQNGARVTTSAGQGLKVVLGERHSLRHRAELMASLQRST